jgi:predicted RNA methylase
MSQYQTLNTVKDIANSDEYFPDIGASARVHAVDASVGDDSYGIIAGTGTTAVTIDDYKIETKIAQGTGTGQLSYGAVTLSITNDGTDQIVEIQRQVINNSGGTITIKELALYAWRASPSNIFCIMRSDEDQAIADGETFNLRMRAKFAEVPFLKQMGAILGYGFDAPSPTYQVKDYQGNGVYPGGPSYATNSYHFSGPCATTFFYWASIIPGSGTTAVTFSDYYVETEIDHGTGSGELTRGASTASLSNPSGNEVRVTISRALTNNSGGSITVNEIAFVVVEASTTRLCIYREVLGTPEVIPDGDSSNFEVRIRLNV